MSDRFAVVRTLGRGGQGSVELVHDRARGELVARKRLIRPEGHVAGTLKRELRMLADLAHPNLVQVHELGEDAAGPFLLMEAVEGRDIVEHCGGAGPELATVLPQLLSVLRYLHERGLAHGDLSPANVLVRRDGWVKLLDFGLAGALGDERAPAGGTLAYLAPERREGRPPTAASDRWALGAILSHVVTGRSPIDGRAGDLPRDPVGAAIAGLMRRSPERRTRLEELERELLPALGASRATSKAPQRATLDRPLLTARVHGTVLGHPGALVLLRGPSGVGKTTLAGEAGRRAAEAGLAVTWARARPEERVAFNLVGELVDHLVDELSAVHLSPRVREAAERASGTFPVLARLVEGDPHWARVRRAVHAELFGADGSPSTTRRGLFEDLRTLLTTTAGVERRLLVLDDLQWADADSVAFLKALLDDGVPQLTLLGTLGDASDVPIAPLIREGSREVVPIDVPLLSEVRVARFLEGQGVDRAVARRIAAACEGLPALVDLALTAAATDDPLAQAVEALVRDGERGEKAALATLLVCGTPLSLGGLVSPAAADRLARRGLVTRSGRFVDIRHDALRGPLRAALGPDWLRAAHERLAAVSSRAGVPAELVRHLEGAGRHDEAARVARDAAGRAERADAHGLAADLYGVALRADRSAELRERRAEALERALRYEEAAEQWAELRRAAGDAGQARRWAMAEAHALLAGRRIAEGRERLDAILRERGDPGIGRGRLHRLATLARMLLGPTGVPVARVRAGAMDAERLLRSATIVGYFDTAAGLRLLLDARDAFVAAGRVEEAAWCELLLSFFSRFGHPRGGPLAARYRRTAERRLDGRAPRSPVVREFPAFLDAYEHLRDGRFAEAVSLFDEALDRVWGTADERSFEVQLTTSLRTSAVLATQDVNAAEAAVARFAALAREGVEVAIQCHVENARALLWTWRGRFEDALAAMDRLRQEWPDDPPTVQALLIETYAALPALLLGDPLTARARLRRALDEGERFGIMRTAYGPIVAAVASACEASAFVRGKGDRRLARRWASRACGQPSVLGGLGHRVLAALEVGEGHTASAVSRYRRAEDEAARLGQPLDAALARFGRGRLTGDLGLQASARHALAEIGASPRLTVEHERLGV